MQYIVFMTLLAVVYRLTALLQLGSWLMLHVFCHHLSGKYTMVCGKLYVVIIILCVAVTIACSYSSWAFAATMAYSFAGMFFCRLICSQCDMLTSLAT